MNQKPIFLLGAHKSGTSLLRSIFNGHSQLYTIPFEAHFFQIMKYWVDNEYRMERPAKLNKDEFIERFNNFIHKMNNAEDKYSDSIPKGLIDENKFQSSFSSIKSFENHKSCFEKYCQAIYYSITGNDLPDKIRIVEKSVENAEFVQELFYFFPKAKFVHIIRNPYSNIVSLRKFKSFRHGAPIMRRIIKTLYNSYYYLYKNKRNIKNYYIIRYEDLAKYPESKIKEMCEFLEIPFEDVLLTPTYQGNVWQGNSTRGIVFNAISSANLEKWKPEIHPMEVEYINIMFYHILLDYGYTPFRKKGLYWSWLKGEDIKHYLANRIYKYYL
jgi:hypothetical protein